MYTRIEGDQLVTYTDDDQFFSSQPVEQEVSLANVITTLREPLANLTPSSASTTVRTAILNQRAALDALLELHR